MTAAGHRPTPAGAIVTAGLTAVALPVEYARVRDAVSMVSLRPLGYFTDAPAWFALTSALLLLAGAPLLALRRTAAGRLLGFAGSTGAASAVLELLQLQQYVTPPAAVLWPLLGAAAVFAATAVSARLGVTRRYLAAVRARRVVPVSYP